MSNHEFAIECYINGLRFAPDSMQHHEALREVALKRKVAGGKPAGMIDTVKRKKGKDPLDRMLNAEYLWAKNPLDPYLALNVMAAAVKAGQAEMAAWIGDFVIDLNRQGKRPSKTVFLKACELYAEIGVYDKAVLAGELALQIDPQNMQLNTQLKNLHALQTEQEGGYGEEGMRGSIRGEKVQRELEGGDQVAGSDAVVDQVLAGARENFEANPQDEAAITRLIDALVRKDDEKEENEAIDILTAAHEQTPNNRFKQRIGEIRIKQFVRRIRALQAQIKESGETDELCQRLRKLRGALLKFELGEYTERVKNYPTDMGFRYELGRRQLEVGDHDAAIASLQQSQADPKNRAHSLHHLGHAFAAKEWHDEAVDTYRRGIEAHANTDDRLAMSLRYDLMTALESKARGDKDAEAASEAAQIASQIAQTNINFRDIRDRVDALRKLNQELKADAEDA